MVANVGNFHTLAFRLMGDQVEGVFEHHTGLVDRQKLDRLLNKFADGTLTHEEIFADHGHGSLIYPQEPFDLGKGGFDVVITGPRRNLMRESSLRTYFAAPYGDMMLTGCFGLLAAAADKLPSIGEQIRNSLYPESSSYSGKPPWELQ